MTKCGECRTKTLIKFQEIEAFFLERDFADHDDIENGIKTVRELGSTLSRPNLLQNGATATENGIRIMLAKLQEAGRISEPEKVLAVDVKASKLFVASQGSWTRIYCIRKNKVRC